jgi:hypothetical protein
MNRTSRALSAVVAVSLMAFASVAFADVPDLRDIQDSHTAAKTLERAEFAKMEYRAVVLKSTPQRISEDRRSQP